MRVLLNRRTFAFGLAGTALLPSLARSDDAVKLRDLYNKDLSFSDLALGLEGKVIAVEGFMAPPLKAESQFFVLTRRPMAVCPFCEAEADWPSDIVAIYTEEIISVVPFNYLISVEGRLELGTYTDEELGFVSRVRLVDAEYERA